MANENNIVLGETKRVLEMMEESEERVVVLQQDLSQKEALLDQLSDNLKELKASFTLNSVTIEDNNDLKNNIEKCNNQLEIFTQQVYTNLQEIYTDYIVNETEWDELEEQIKKCEERYDEKVGELDEDKEKLGKELQMLMEAITQKHEKEELDSQMLAAENEDLKDELIKINNEIEKYIETIKDGSTLDQDIERYTEEISKLQETIMSVDEAINSASQELEEIDKEKERIEKDSEKSICELNKKIEEADNEVTNLTEMLEKNKAYDLELFNQLKNLEESNEKWTKEYEMYEKELNSIKMSIKELQEKEEKENASLIVFRKESDIYLLNLKEVKVNFLSEVELFKGKCSQQEEKIGKLFADIKTFEESLSKIDLRKEHEEKQEELKELKTARLEIKEQYNKKFLEEEIESKKVQEEIDEIEMKNKELHKNIDLSEMEINQIKVKEEVLKIEKEHLEHKSKELDNQLDAVKTDIAKIKIEKNKQAAKPKAAIAPKPFLKPSTSNAEKNKNERHWDSDSSVEGENRRFSEIAKQRLKKKLQKKC